MTFKVLSYNIRYGGDGRLSEIAGIIRAQQPDAVSLLEANSQSNAETLARDLGMDLAYGQANSEYAVAWMSCASIEGSQNHRLKVLAKTLLEVKVNWKGVVLSLFATHLIGGRTAEDAHQRALEAQAILDALRSLADQPHLLVGDFNAVHPDDPVGHPPPGEKTGYIARQPVQLVLNAGYVDCYRRLHTGAPGYTYPSRHPWLRLDYVFASRSMAALLCAGDVVMAPDAQRASDHLPVWAEFRR